MNRFRLVLVCLTGLAAALSAAAPARADDFTATQVRFCSTAVDAVDVALSRFGTYTAIADRTDGNSVRVLDENWELLWRHRQPVYWAGTFRHAPMLQFAPDESFLIYPAYRTENDITLVNPRTGEPISVLSGHSGTVDCIALSPDGARMVSAAEKEVFLWRRDGASFTLADKLADHEGSVNSVAFSPDGSLVVTCETDDTARRIVLYRVDQDHLTAVSKYENEENNLSYEFSQLAFSPDGRWIAAGYADVLMVFERTGTDLRLAQKVPDIELGAVISVAFTPDGALLLTGHYRDVRAWRLVNGSWQAAATFTPHIGLVRAMRFSMDGTRLAIAGRADTNAVGQWSLTGVGPSPLGGLFTLLGGKLSTAQRDFLDDATSARILSSLAPADTAPRDMFETEKEYAARRGKARGRAASLLQEETEKHFSAERAPAKGALYEVSVPLQTQGTYAIDSKTYSIHFMDTDAVVKLERDPARDLYKNWQAARVRATRLQTDDGTTYDDFRVSLPDTTEQFPVGLWENPFTGEKLDRYGARVPSTTIGPDLLVRNLSIDGVFPALFHYYADHSLGTLTLQNTGANTITDLSVRLNVPGLMKASTDAAAPAALGVGQSVDVSIRAVFDPSVLDRNQGGSVSAELSIQYTVGGKPYADTIRRPIGLLNRNAMRWTNDLKVGAFMSTDDPALLRWSGQVMGMGDDLATNVLTRNLFSAVRMFEGMKATGVRYVVDPATPYESLSRDSTAIDFLRFPTETLDAKSGQCDDLSVLYNSLLESVGVDTAYITTPGHIFAAFNLGMTPELASKTFAKSEDLIVRAGVVWMPVETTMVDEGFTKAWQTAAVEWREASERGTAGFFTSKEAWQLYLPAGFFGVPSTVPPARDQMLALLNGEIDAFRAAVLAPREADLLAALAKTSSAAQENQLGILYAQFGLLSKALEHFEKAIVASKYVPAMINAANVCGLKKDYAKAQEYLKRAQKLQPENTRVLIALAYSYFQAGNQVDAKKAYQRMSKVDPGLAARYPLFGAAAAAPGQGRAARADKAAELFGTDWTQ